MKIQCNSCELAEATVLCCADEAALCRVCDEKVHAANKLASKHQRVSLLNSGSPMPNCDICQETGGYFFCLEDRALLCRKCDVAVHTANSYVSRHQRFLLTGVKVGLERTEPISSPPAERMSSSQSLKRTRSTSFSKKVTPMTFEGGDREMFPGEGGGGGTLPTNKVSFSSNKLTGSMPPWPLDEFLNLSDFNQNYGFAEPESSKSDGGNLREYNWSPIYCAATEECLVEVPELPSPPTVSGLYWPKNYKHSVSVPDVGYSLPQQHSQKRHRKFGQLQ